MDAAIFADVRVEQFSRGRPPGRCGRANRQRGAPPPNPAQGECQMVGVIKTYRVSVWGFYDTKTNLRSFLAGEKGSVGHTRPARN